MKKLLIGLVVVMLGAGAFATVDPNTNTLEQNGYHFVKINKVIVHFGYVVLQASSTPENNEFFEDMYFIVPKEDNSLSNRKETLATLLSAQALGCDVKIWIHEATIDAGAGVVGNTLYSVQVITK